MKKIISAMLFFFVVANATYGQATAGDYSRSGNQLAADRLSLSLKDGKLVLNKVEITKGWELEPVARYLGTGGRIRPGSNTTHTYDDFGIVLFEKTIDDKPTGEILELQVFISQAEKNDVSPAGFYKGNLEIEKKKISVDLSLADLRNDLKLYKESKSYLPHNYRFSNDGVYMYVQYDENDKEIERISLGKDTREQ